MEANSMGDGETQNSFVFRIEVHDQECVVVPMEVTANVGDLVTFENLTGGRVIVFFLNQEIFGQPTYVINPEGKTTLTVGDVTDGDYYFDVYCELTDSHLNRAARPRIIVVRQ
jgi:plastocyanin